MSAVECTSELCMNLRKEKLPRAEAAGVVLPFLHQHQAAALGLRGVLGSDAISQILPFCY